MTAIKCFNAKLYIYIFKDKLSINSAKLQINDPDLHIDTTVIQDILSAYKVFNENASLKGINVKFQGRTVCPISGYPFHIVS